MNQRGAMKLTRTQRLIQMVQLLQTGRHYDIDSLIRELGKSKRTVFRDLKTLKDSGVISGFDADTQSYSIDRSYFLQPVNMTLEEGLALMTLTRKFIDERVTPAFAAATSAALKIESILPDEIRESCGRLLEGVAVDWSPVSDVDAITDILGRVQQAIADHSKLRMRYDSFSDKTELELTVRPYVTLFKSRGWYLIAYSERHRQYRTFKLERIVNMKLLKEKFRRDPKFNIKSYYGNAWSMIRGDRAHHVEIHFSAKVAGNVEEVVWHHTQRTRRRSDGTLVFEVDVDGIEEIAWWIMGYGDQAVVQEPQELRHVIASHAQNLTRYYQSNVSMPIERD